MKTKKTIILEVLLIIAVIIFWYFVGAYVYKTYFRNEPDQAIVGDVKKSDPISMASELANKYNAIVGWDGDAKYTIQLQQKLIQERPAIFDNVGVRDIFERNGRVFVQFSNLNLFDFVYVPMPDEGIDFLSMLNMPNYLLELECDKDIIDRSVDYNIQEENANRYAVVANIYSVSKNDITLSAAGFNSGEYDGVDVDIDSEPSKLFILIGTCLDIVRYKNDN